MTQEGLAHILKIEVVSSAPPYKFLDPKVLTSYAINACKPHGRVASKILCFGNSRARNISLGCINIHKVSLILAIISDHLSALPTSSMTSIIEGVTHFLEDKTWSVMVHSSKIYETYALASSYLLDCGRIESIR